MGPPSRSWSRQKELDRASGDYNQFWHDRNYLLHADRVQAEVVFTHGSQDWNVKPLHVFNMFLAPSSKHQETPLLPQWCPCLPQQLAVHWLSVRAWMPFSKNCWATIQAMRLPTVIWQDNTGEQSWTSLDDFGNQTSQRTFSLGDGEKSSKTATRQRLRALWQGFIRPS